MNASFEGLTETAGKQPILVPVDFSSCSRNALVFASRFIGCVQAPILVLHVIHDHNRRPGLYKSQRRNGPLRPIEDIAADMLAEFVETVRQIEPANERFASLETRLVTGLPATRIVEVAVREDAAMIIMGTHTRSVFSRLVSGSVTAEVVKHSPIPVTVVKTPVAAQENVGVISPPGWWKRRPGISDTDSERRDNVI